MSLRVVAAWIALTLASACAATVTRASSAPDNADALYHAALLPASPDQPAYDPDRAAHLLAEFIERFPSDRRRHDAAGRLALLNEVRALRAELRALKAIDLARPPR
jgi:hypothetical protein